MPHQWKGYASAVGLVFASLVVFASSASANTLYVKCSGKVPNYLTIQAAVNAADSGDTIKVCEGTYTETVNVNDAVKLYDGLKIEAEDGVKLRCHTSGQTGSGIDLHANHIKIEGLDISRCASGLSVESGYGGELFADNHLHDNTTGISFNSSSGDNSVVDNEITDNSGDGVFDFRPQGDYFFSNEIYHNGRNGIEISTTTSGNSTLPCAAPAADTCAVIVDNEISENGPDPAPDPGVGNGVYLNHADTVDVKWNKLSKNTHDGLYSNHSNNGVIAANDANGNGHDGVEFSSGSTGNKVVDNRMDGNTNFDADDHDANTWTNNDCTTHGGSASCAS